MMKPYIIVGSRYGATRTCGEYIANKTGGVCVGRDEVNWEDASCIVLGSNVYAGMFHKDIKKFVKANQEQLLQKKVMLFVCGIAKETMEKEVNENIPREIVNHISKFVFVNGVLDFTKMNIMERGIIKLIMKKREPDLHITNKDKIDRLDYEQLDELCVHILSL